MNTEILLTAESVADRLFEGKRRRIYSAINRSINPFPKSREIAGRATWLQSEVEIWLQEELDRNNRGDRRQWPRSRRVEV